MKEFHSLINTKNYKLLLDNLKLDHLMVLELGVGTGSLSELILQQPIRRLIGFEIIPNLCQIKHPKFTLIEKNYQTTSIPALDILICNPAYSTLSFIKKYILPFYSKAILMIPENMLETFNDFEILFSLKGSDFLPEANGKHYVVGRNIFSLLKD